MTIKELQKSIPQHFASGPSAIGDKSAMGAFLEFRAALEHIVGVQPAIETISIGPDDEVERRRKDILDAVHKVDDGSGVILLTDMFGGTPSNLAISVMEPGKVEVVAGVNLPMLIKLASIRSDKPLATAIDDAQDAGRKYINVASQVLNGK